MYEVELKVRADHAAVRAALAREDAAAVDRVAQADTYFDAPHREFAATDEALRVRRVAALPEDWRAGEWSPEGSGAGAGREEDGGAERDEDGGAEREGEGERDAVGRLVADAVGSETGGEGVTTRVTYKGPLVDEESKTRREVETGVEDAAAMVEILEALGFTAAATVRKVRETYTLAGFQVVLDAVAGLGTFVEVEREVPEGEVAGAREGARDVLRRLDLDPDAGIRTSYLGLLLGE